MSVNASAIASGSWFDNVALLPDVHTRECLTGARYVVNVLPAYGAYYAMAVLVLVPGTRRYRLAFLPVALLAVFRAATTYDVACAVPHDNFKNYGHGVIMMAIVMRMVDWATASKPLQRIRAANETGSGVFWDAADLISNFRGIGWTWSKGLHIPAQTRPMHSARAFIFTTARHLAGIVLLFDSLHYLVQLLGADSFGSPAGGSIFLPSLAPLARYAYSTFLTGLSGYVIYLSLVMYYDIATLLALLLPLPGKRDPARWPPFSDAPWKATSLSELWARRWHQVFRRTFIAFGGAPAQRLFGRAGGVLGTFTASGILHSWPIWGMGHGVDFTQLGGFFLLMSCGVVAEGVWKRVTGKAVGGWAGWAWTMSTVLGAGHLLINGWEEKGLAGGMLIPTPLRPGKLWMDWVISKLA